MSLRNGSVARLARAANGALLFFPLTIKCMELAVKRKFRYAHGQLLLISSGEILEFLRRLVEQSKE